VLVPRLIISVPGCQREITRAAGLAMEYDFARSGLDRLVILGNVRTPAGLCCDHIRTYRPNSAQNTHLYRQHAEKVVNVIFAEIAAAMAHRDRVELRGFGAFFVKLREGRTGRNPRTGALVSVESKAVPFFRSGKEMRSILNSGSDPETGRNTVP
jgi:integration host factor subunit beta